MAYARAAKSGDGVGCDHAVSRAVALFAVEKNQIGGDGFGAELAEHGRDLAAMIGAVIDEVLQHLPERRGLRHAGRRLVLHDALHSSCVSDAT